MRQLRQLALRQVRQDVPAAELDGAEAQKLRDADTDISVVLLVGLLPAIDCPGHHGVAGEHTEGNEDKHRDDHWLDLVPQELLLLDVPVRIDGQRPRVLRSGPAFPALVGAVHARGLQGSVIDTGLGLPEADLVVLDEVAAADALVRDRSCAHERRHQDFLRLDGHEGERDHLPEIVVHRQHEGLAGPHPGAPPAWQLALRPALEVVHHDVHRGVQGIEADAVNEHDVADGGSRLLGQHVVGLQHLPLGG